MEEFAKKLKLPFPGDLFDDEYIIPLVDSDEYSQAYSILDASDLVELDTDSTLVTDKVSELTYLGDEYTVKLVANFVDDLYKIVIMKAEE